MRKSLQFLVVAFALSGSGTALWAQETRTDGTTTSRTVADRDDDGFDYGWLGLAGLLGLIGLMPRDRRDRHATPVVHTSNR